MEIGTGKKKMGLSTQIFIALLAGAICGVCVHYFLKEGYFRDTILVGGDILCSWTGIYSADADAGRSSGVVFAGVWKHVHR